MGFCIKNNLSVFEFHDAAFSFVSFDGQNMTICAKLLNIHKGTEQNPSEFDMEIDRAQIVFKNFRRAWYEPGRTWKAGEDGTSYPVGSRIIWFGQDGIEKIVAELKSEISVFFFEKGDHGWCFGGCGGIEPYLDIGFDFDEVEVSWAKYLKKAWYELHRQYDYRVLLTSETGEASVNLKIITNEDQKTLQPHCSVGCRYRGVDYWARGEDHLWIEAFADLQKKLPQGIFLKCCLTCRHGNLCPVGNNPNEVFCTKDVSITKKSDLYFFTEDETERKKRAREYCSVCEDYQSQNEAFYTYSDYLRLTNLT